MVAKCTMPIWRSCGMFLKTLGRIIGGFHGRYMEEGLVRLISYMVMLIVLCTFLQPVLSKMRADMVFLFSGVEQADEVVGAMLGCGIEVCEPYPPDCSCTDFRTGRLRAAAWQRPFPGYCCRL
jgi:hypothetical protein